jgi:hypothetical protein
LSRVEDQPYHDVCYGLQALKRLSTTAKIVLAGAAVKAAMFGLWLRRKRSGHVPPASGEHVVATRFLCPSELGRPHISAAEPGDYVAVALRTGTRTEWTWARVVGEKDGRLFVEIVGQLAGESPQQLHGSITVGDKAFIALECAWELFRKTVPILCGEAGARIAGRSPVESDIATGQAVMIVVDASGGGFAPTWGIVRSISSTGSVVEVALPTGNTTVDVTRDCVFDVR